MEVIEGNNYNKHGRIMKLYILIRLFIPDRSLTCFHNVKYAQLIICVSKSMHGKTDNNIYIYFFNALNQCGNLYRKNFIF